MSTLSFKFLFLASVNHHLSVLQQHWLCGSLQRESDQIKRLLLGCASTLGVRAKGSVTSQPLLSTTLTRAIK